MSTPMMQQYRRIKNQHRDAVLFYRLGDFYEMFEEDAQTGSRILGLTLTQRQGIPMCGVPYHSAHSYIGRLLRNGRKVAICEQITLPEKGLAERAVTEVLSPGTVFEEDFLEPDQNNYLLAVGHNGTTLNLAWTDISTGTIELASFPEPVTWKPVLLREMARIQPREILVQESLLEGESNIGRELFDGSDIVTNRYPDWSFDRETGFTRITEALKVRNLHGFGIDDEETALSSLAVILQYLEDNTRQALNHITKVHLYRPTDHVILDDATQRNLELTGNIRDGSKKYSLFSIIDQAKTGMGSRHLRRRLLWPRRDRREIERSLNRVEELYRDQNRLYRLREILSQSPDLERLIGRLGVGKAHPKDIYAAAEAIGVASNMARTVTDWLDPTSAGTLAPEGTLHAFRAEIVDVFTENPPVIPAEGGIFREGYDDELDRYRSLRNHGKAHLDTYLEEQRDSTGISSLKIRYNRMIGHFFETPSSQNDKIPDYFIRRQSLTNSERFTTAELSRLETEITSAGASAIERELELFAEIKEKAVALIPVLTTIAAFVASVDATQALAWVATERGYCRPVLSDKPVLSIRGGRHPVVEAHMPVGSFVANDLVLGGESSFFALVTGPNMAGKSTVLRQTALIVLMAHMGGFVPAEYAEIGTVDRIFCRVGASDNIARGESTFLVEMNEASNILRNATTRSLVIMDEVGRGTSTHDGLAIAWSIIEYLLNVIECRTLFATHYHELTEIEHKEFINLSMAVRHEPDIVFLKRLVEGSEDRSYGIDVARLAGMPELVIERARVLLEHFEGKAPTGPPRSVPSELHSDETQSTGQEELFSPTDIVISELSAVNPDELSPREALELVYRIQSHLQKRV